MSEESSSYGSPLLIDRIFAKYPIMEKLREGGLNNTYDSMDRPSNGLTMLDGPMGCRKTRHISIHGSQDAITPLEMLTMYNS